MTHPSLPFSPESRAERGAKALDRAIPGWAQALAPAWLMGARNPRGWVAPVLLWDHIHAALPAGYAARLGITNETGITERHVLWTLGLLYASPMMPWLPVLQQLALEDRLDRAWVLEVFARQRYPRYLPTVVLTEPVCRALHEGLLVLRPGQWVRYPRGPRLRFAGLSTDGAPVLAGGAWSVRLGVAIATLASPPSTRGL